MEGEAAPASHGHRGSVWRSEREEDGNVARGPRAIEREEGPREAPRLALLLLCRRGKEESKQADKGGHRLDFTGEEVKPAREREGRKADFTRIGPRRDDFNYFFI